MRKNLFAITILLVLTVTFPAPAGIIYVDDSRSGDGSSWEEALSSLQSALAIAVAGDEIHVARGTYYPDRGGGQRPG